MEDWLPSQRSAGSGSREASRASVATDDRGTRQRNGFTETIAAKVRPRPQTRPPAQRLVRRDIMIRRVDPWTVLKISVVFYTCILIIGVLANAVLWAIIGQLGLIDQITELAQTYNVALTIRTGNILQAVFLLGVLGVVFWTAVNVFLAFLYNLVADLIGGIRVDLAEDE